MSHVKAGSFREMMDEIKSRLRVACEELFNLQFRNTHEAARQPVEDPRAVAKWRAPHGAEGSVRVRLTRRAP